MTLEEAIKHCLNIAEKGKECAGTELSECGKDFQQLAEFLKELIAYRKLRICGNCRHYVCGTTHFGECHVTSDIEPTVVCVNETGCDRFIHKDYKEEK